MKNLYSASEPVIMSSSVYHQRIWCITENAWIEDWKPYTLTVCPNNNTHTVNANSVQLLDEVSTQAVKVQEEFGPQTGGHFQILSIPFAITAGVDTVTVFEHSEPIPYAFFSVSMTSSAEHEGDLFQVDVSPDTIAGVLTADAAPGATTLAVSQTVIDNVWVGMYVSLTDGVTSNACNRITAIDTVNNTLTVETATTDAFSAATPTYVQFSIRMIRDYEFGPAGHIDLGATKLGSTYLPADTTVRFTYTNKEGSAKRIVLVVAVNY